MHLLDRLLPSLETWLSSLIGRRVAARLCEFFVFGLKELAACVFAGSFLLLLALSNHFTVPGVARYDLLFVGAIAIQLMLIVVRLENWREVAVLSLFHLLGMGLELFKTSLSVRSWSYPESSVFHIGSVPLYSGFMYAAVASYLMQAWRLLDVRVSGFPRFWLAIAIAIAIYANFFTNHYILDLRWPLGLVVFSARGPIRINFTAGRSSVRTRLVPGRCW
jgi:uncharacterized membrane protein YoaT (DUF817 family)